MIDNYCPLNIQQTNVAVTSCDSASLKLGDVCVPSSCAAGYSGSPQECTCNVGTSETGVWSESIGCTGM